MISSKCDVAAIVLGTNIVFLLLMISLVGLGHFETLAQGTNATASSTNATNGINATGSSGGRAGEVSVVMPLGSSEGSVQTGYDPGYDPHAIAVRAPFDITASERTMPTYLIASYTLSADTIT